LAPAAKRCPLKPGGYHIAGQVIRDLLERLRLVPEEVASLMLIGHNPGLQELALALASAGPELARLKTKFRSRPSD
jgi:phosphohistidine phosphatase SixA